MNRDLNTKKEVLGKIIDDSVPSVNGNENTKEKYPEMDITYATLTISDLVATVVVLAITWLLPISCFFYWDKLRQYGDAKYMYLIVSCITGFVGAIVLFVSLKRIFRHFFTIIFGKKVVGLVCECKKYYSYYYIILVRTKNGYRKFNYYLDGKNPTKRKGDLINFKVFNKMVYIRYI